MPQVPVDSIDIVSGDRVEDPDQLDFLAMSVKSVGLLHPPVVMENPLVPGRHTMISGRRRLNVVKNLLKWQMIEVSIRTLSEVQIEMIETGENLCRLDYTAIERADAMKRYVALHSAAHPEVREYMEKVKANDKNLRQFKAAENEAEKPKDLPAGPIEAVAAKFGKAESTIRKSVKRAEAFTTEEKAVLRDRKLSNARLDALTKVAPAEKVVAINLLAAGMDYTEAMKEAVGDKFVDDGEDDDPIADEEFLASCPARKQSNKTKFDADALLYRAIQKQKIAFAKSIAWGGMKTKVGDGGSYMRRLMFFMETKHPRDWLHCGQCVQGLIKGGATCGTCRGGGYVIG